MDDWGDPHFRANTVTELREEQHRALARTASSYKSAKKVLAPYFTERYAAVTPDFEFQPGFIYTQVRAISARINQNYDGWPSSELKKAYRSFLGKPVFVNHQNFDPSKARGKVVASRYVEAGDDKYIETVMEIDAQRFPMLAHEIKTGGMDSVSMGVEAGFTICSYCGNKAVDVPDFCSHVKYHKGRVLPRTNTKTGKKEDVLVYEKCYKLGFFELSYVFDPADETAVVSRVIAAAEQKQQTYPDEIVAPVMPTTVMPTAKKHHHFNPEFDDIEDTDDDTRTGAYHYAYGEIEAPEDVDTLRDDDEDDMDHFKHYVDSPKELRGPDLDQTKRLDRAQEQEGLDADRRAEDVEDIGGQLMPNRAARRRGPNVLIDPRTGRKYYAADDDSSSSGKSDSELLSEAEADLKKAEDQDSPPPGSNAGGSDDDYSDSDDDSDDDSDSDEDSDDDSDDSESDGDSDGDSDSKPPWLKKKESRSNGKSRSSAQNKRRATRGGAPMSLAQRGQVVASRQLRHADNSGHTDGGPYGENDQGEQEEVFLSQTPSAESFSPPKPGDGTISNTENNLVASLSQRIQARNAELRRDIIAYEQLTGQRLTADNYGQQTAPNATLTPPAPDTSQSEFAGVSGSGSAPLGTTASRHYAEAVATPDQVNPSVNSGSGAEELTGDDFDSIALDKVETQPKDASIHAFRAFDSWLQRATGRTASQHGNPNFIRRSAARYCSAAGVPVESLFPALGSVLQAARKGEGSTTRRSNMNRHADEKLELAAPQDRIDVESPVSNVTDADAQASQYSLKDFGGNASDNLADPELSVDSQIWAPGKGESAKNANRKADGITAVRYADAFIAAGLAENTPEDRYKIAGLAQTMRHGTIVDRTRLLEACNAVTARRFASLRRTAGARSGAGRGLPPGLSQRQLTAGSAPAANDIANDSALFFKG